MRPRPAQGQTPAYAGVKTNRTASVVEFRDGAHGIVAWALAVVITGLVAAVSAASLAPGWCRRLRLRLRQRASH